MSKLVPLHNRKGKIVAHTVVDDADYERLSQWSWTLSSTGYALRSTRNSDNKQQFIPMHHEILDTPLETDHRDRNKLNNQRANLRPATRSQNSYNIGSRPNSSSQFKGVSWSSGKKRWIAQIVPDRKKRWLGCFKTELEAARAYDAAAILHFGEFAYLNFPDEVTS